MLKMCVIFMIYALLNVYFKHLGQFENNQMNIKYFKTCFKIIINVFQCCETM
jgi:hypothetical protein